MNSTLMSIINIYLMSNLFIYDKKKLEKKSGLNEAILFDFVANNICDYFKYGKSISNKKEDIPKNIDINDNKIKSNIIKIEKNKRKNN